MKKTFVDQLELVNIGAQIYGIQLLHIFEIPSISNERPSISIEIPSKTLDLDRNTRYFEPEILKY